MQAVSGAELQVTEAQQRLMQLEQDKAELDKQLRQTQEAVLAGKQRVEKLREEVQRRTEARTVSASAELTLPNLAVLNLSADCQTQLAILWPLRLAQMQRAALHVCQTQQTHCCKADVGNGSKRCCPLLLYGVL